jgi:hypothetical protein
MAQTECSGKEKELLSWKPHMLVANRASTEVIDVLIDLNKGTVYLSSELFPFFCMYIVLIHGLTSCIQQNVPSVRLILTDHGLDRMFWKGKGAVILGCTSPFKAIMIVHIAQRNQKKCYASV